MVPNKSSNAVPTEDYLALRVSTTPDEVCIRLTGELDVSTAGHLLQLKSQLCLDGHKSIVLDVTGLAFCDARGLSALLSLHRELERQGRRMSIRGASRRVRRPIDVTGSDSVLNLE